MFTLFNKLILLILKLLPRKLIFIFAGRYVAGDNILNASAGDFILQNDFRFKLIQV